MNNAGRKLLEKMVHIICAVITVSIMLILALFLISLLQQAWGKLDWQFLSSYPSRNPDAAGVKAALAGSAWIAALTALFSVPIGVAAAVYLEEYAASNKLNSLLEISIANLAGVPSIVFGLLGLAVFVRYFGFDRSVLSAALTLSLLVLPTIIVVSREALRSVSGSLRSAAYALGATRFETIRDHVIPAALPGIMTGVILSLSRAIGETAPILMIGALAYVSFVPVTPLDSFSALPVQIFTWASRPQPAFMQLAAAGIIVLMALVLSVNATAIVIRQKAQRRIRC